MQCSPFTGSDNGNGNGNGDILSPSRRTTAARARLLSHIQAVEAAPDDHSDRQNAGPRHKVVDHVQHWSPSAAGAPTMGIETRAQCGGVVGSRQPRDIAHDGSCCQPL